MAEGGRDYPCTLADIQAAAKRIAPHVHCTPVRGRRCYCCCWRRYRCRRCGTRTTAAPPATRRPAQVLTSSTLDRLAGEGRRLFFKAEVFQKSGSFKIRGATTAGFSLSEEEAARGVVTHSSGNHGAAVALAASWRGVRAQVVVPANTPLLKRRALEVRRAAGRLASSSRAGRGACLSLRAQKHMPVPANCAAAPALLPAGPQPARCGHGSVSAAAG